MTDIPNDIVRYTLEFTQYAGISSQFQTISSIMDEETLGAIHNVYHFWNRSLPLMKYQMNRAALDGGWDTILLMLRYIPFAKGTSEYISIFSYAIELLRQFQVDNLMGRVIAIADIEISQMTTPSLLYAAWSLYGTDTTRIQDLQSVSLSTSNIIYISEYSWRAYIHPLMRQYLSTLPNRVMYIIRNTSSNNMDILIEDNYRWGSIDTEFLMEEHIITPNMIKTLQRELTVNSASINVYPQIGEINPIIIEHTYQWWNTHNMEDINEIIYSTYEHPPTRLAMTYATGTPMTEDVIYYEPLSS